MKASDIREQTAEELETRLNDIKKNIFNLKFQKAIGQLEDTQAIRNLRKDIALVETLLREKELGLNKEIKVKKSGSAKKKTTSARTAAKKAAPEKSKKTKDKSTDK
jgi:large subunit ribosomal protein L29